MLSFPLKLNEVTVLGITSSVTLLEMKQIVVMSLSYKTPSLKVKLGLFLKFIFEIPLLLNAELSRLVRLSGRVISVSFLQPENALPPISVTLFGIVTPIRLVQPANVLPSIFFTPSGIVISVSFLQPANAPSPILVTLLGIVISVRPVQLWKAREPMLVTPSGIVTLVRDLHSENM